MKIFGLLCFGFIVCLCFKVSTAQPGCPPAACCDDVFEVNDFAPDAKPITIGVQLNKLSYFETQTELTLCNATDVADFYNLTAPGNGYFFVSTNVRCCCCYSFMEYAICRC